MTTISKHIDVNTIKGFMPHDEGMFLYQTVKALHGDLPIVEIGSYCGKSAVYLGEACRASGRKMFTVDHHSGSEEHQQGEEYFDEEVFDTRLARPNSLPLLQQTLLLAQLENIVIPVVADSAVVASTFHMPLAAVFIDGGHSLKQARLDCSLWSKHIVTGGLLLMHDIYSDPLLGGQAPKKALDELLAHDDFILIDTFKSVCVLRKN